MTSLGLVFESTLVGNIYKYGHSAESYCWESTVPLRKLRRRRPTDVAVSLAAALAHVASIPHAVRPREGNQVNPIRPYIRAQGRVHGPTYDSSSDI
jgi:hypothetical protein